LADRFKQPFEYFDGLDVDFVNKMFIIIKAESDEHKKMIDEMKNKK